MVLELLILCPGRDSADQQERINEQALITFYEAGFFRELQWKQIKHDKMDEKPIDGWFQFYYVLDLAKGTENQYIIIG